MHIAEQSSRIALIERIMFRSYVHVVIITQPLVINFRASSRMVHSMYYCGAKLANCAHCADHTENCSYRWCRGYLPPVWPQGLSSPGKPQTVHCMETPSKVDNDRLDNDDDMNGPLNLIRLLSLLWVENPRGNRSISTFEKGNFERMREEPIFI